jgi:hypothetical protein
MGYPAVGARPCLQGEAAKASPKGCKVEGGVPPTFKPRARFRSASARSASAIKEGARAFGTGVPGGLGSLGGGKNMGLLPRSLVCGGVLRRGHLLPRVPFAFGEGMV